MGYKLISWMACMAIVYVAMAICVSFTALDFVNPLGEYLGRGLFAAIGCYFALHIALKDYEVDHD